MIHSAMNRNNTTTMTAMRVGESVDSSVGGGGVGTSMILLPRKQRGWVSFGNDMRFE